MQPLGNDMPPLLPPLIKNLCNFYYCYIVVDEERSLEILVELNLCLSNTLESPVVSFKHISHVIAIT